MLARYVRRHHAHEQIIRDKLEGTMTRNKLKGTCLLTKFEPRNVKDALDNKIWIEAMNEEIKKIERNKSPRNKASLVCKGYSQEERY